MTMCRVNFLKEFNLIMRYSKQYGLSLRERMLWIALLYIANDRAVYDEQIGAYDWPDDYFPVSNGELELESTLDKRAISTVRNSLKQRGLIDFRPGMKNARVPEYRLIYRSLHVGCKIVPNDVPNMSPTMYPTNPQECTQHVPNSVPNETPLYKLNINKEKERIDYQKKLGIDNAYRVNERARNKTAQLLCDEMIEKGLMPVRDTLQELICEGLELGFTPNALMQLAWDHHGNPAELAQYMSYWERMGKNRLNFETAEGCVCEFKTRLSMDKMGAHGQGAPEL